MSESTTSTTRHPILKVVILHEDSDVSQHVETLMMVVNATFEEVAEVCVKRWSFHQLERLDVRAMASHLGKDASILMVCTSSGQMIPESVTSWMERTYQSPHCLKPSIIRYWQGAEIREDFTWKMASIWNVPIVSEFSLNGSTCWEHFRLFVEQRLSRCMQGSEEECLEAEKQKNPPRARAEPVESHPMDQEIRDHAYYLWVEAGKPDGCHLEFWHQAEREIREAQAAAQMPEPVQQTHPNIKPHENNHPTDHHHWLPAAEFMHRIPRNLHAGSRNALLQHLARIPKKLLTISRHPCWQHKASRGGDFQARPANSNPHSYSL